MKNLSRILAIPALLVVWLGSTILLSHITNTPVSSQTHINAIQGMAADGVAVSGNPLLVAGQDGTNAQSIKTDSSGELQVDVLTVPNITVSTFPDNEPFNLAQYGGSGVGASNAVHVQPGTSAVFPVSDNGSSLTIDGTVTANAGTGTFTTSDTATQVDDAAFAPATGRVLMLGAEFDNSSPDSVDEGDGGALRMSANRNLFSTIRDAAGNERGVNVTASNELLVSVNNSTLAVTQSGTWNLNNISGTISLPTGASTLAEQQSQTTALQLIDDIIFTDDAAFTPATSKLAALGAMADESSTDSIDEGDIGIPRMTLNRKLLQVISDPSTAALHATIRDLSSNDALNVSIVDGSGNQVTSFGGSGGTSMTDDAAFTPGSGSITPVGFMLDDSSPDTINEGDAGIPRMSANRVPYFQIRDAAGNERGANVDASNNLMVNLGVRLDSTNDSIAGGHVDDAAFTVATDRVFSAGFMLDDSSPDSVNEGDVGVPRMSANRVPYFQIRDAAGNERGVNVNSSNQLSVSVDNSLTVTANAGTNLNTSALLTTSAFNTVFGSASLILTTQADDVANTADGLQVSAFGYVFDGTTWDRLPGTATDGVLVNLGANNDVAVSGTVTANQGGNWSVRAQDGAGNALTSAARGSERALSVQIVDGSGNQIASFGGGTQYTEGDVDTTITGTALLFEGGSNTLLAATGDASNGLDVDVTRVQGTVTVAGGKTNDNAAPGATNVGALTAVANESAPAWSEGNLVALSVNTAGALRVTGGGGGTEYVVNDAAPANPTGATFTMERDDALSALTEVEGDWTNPRANANGALWVAVDGSITVNAGTDLNTSALLTTSAFNSSQTSIINAVELIDNIVFTEDTATADQQSGVPIFARRTATPANQSGTDGDLEWLQMSAGRLWVSAVLDTAIPAGNNNIGDVDVASFPDNEPFNVAQWGGTTVLNGGTAGSVSVGGVVAHDASASAVNPFLGGLYAVDYGSDPTAVAAGDLVRSISNRDGVQYVQPGHPNMLTVAAAYTSAQDDTAIVSVSAGTRIVVTGITVTCDNANTVDVGFYCGFGAANTPTTTGVVSTHPGLAPGTGIIEGGAGAILGIGGDGEDLRIDSEAPTTGSIRVKVTYYLVEN